MAERSYVSLKNESARMFKSDFLEFFSRVHPATPLVLYLPLIFYALYYALWRAQLPVLSAVGLLMLGLVIWTLLEYIIHRYAFHYEPKTRLGEQLHFIVHGVHHDFPNDPKRLVMPPVVSVPLAVVFLGTFLAIFGRSGAPVWGGFALGYVCYDTLHYAIHHFPMKSAVWAWLKQHHLRHHYQNDHTGYGVSSPLWDYVFRTERK